MLQVFVVGGIKGIAVQCDQHLCVIGGQQGIYAIRANAHQLLQQRKLA